VASVAILKNFNIRNIDPAAPKMPTYHNFGGVGFENQTLWSWFPEDPDDRRVFENDTKVPATFSILFRAGEPFPSTPVFTVLTALVRKVEGIISRFRALPPPV
jgi:hypothetical protein